MVCPMEIKARKVWLECEDCGSKEITASKTVHYKNWESALLHEIFCHDGFGWDLNTFEFKCAKCGSENIIVKWEEDEK